MCGVNDLRVETFDLRDITDDEIPAKIYTDSLCMSSYKAASRAANISVCRMVWIKTP